MYITHKICTALVTYAAWFEELFVWCISYRCKQTIRSLFEIVERISVFSSTYIFICKVISEMHMVFCFVM